MRTLRLQLALIALGATACATPGAAPTTAVQTQYVQGQMLTTSPNGAEPYGPPVAVLAKRVIDVQKGTIVEDSWHDAEHHHSIFTLQAGTQVFNVRDEGDTFKGTVTYAAADWTKSAATYAIDMTDGSGSIAGTGAWKDEVYETDKVFSDPTKTPRARIKESLKLISKEAFEAATAALTAK